MTQAIGVAALEDRAYHEEAVRRTLDQRARLETRAGGAGLSAGPNRRRTSCSCEIGERAEAVYRALKQEGLLVRWWRAPELRTKIRISVGKPDENDHLLAAVKRLT